MPARYEAAENKDGARAKKETKIIPENTQRIIIKIARGKYVCWRNEKREGSNDEKELLTSTAGEARWTHRNEPHITKRSNVEELLLKIFIIFEI